MRMHPIEENILSQLKQSQDIRFGDRDTLHLFPLGTLSQEFYSELCVKQYCEKRHGHAKKLGLRLALEEYLASERSQPYLENIEAAILKLPSPMSSFGAKGLQNKAAGTYLMPVSPELIRQIYQLEDISLTNLFQKHFPVPPTHLFEEDSVPDVIQKRDIAVLETMRKTPLHALEPFIIKAQRSLRMKKRHQEEVNRIAQRDEFHLKYHHMSTEALDASDESNQPPQIHQWAEELLQDANTPYKPKCAPELSDRIMAAARKVSVFSTVKHITSETALQKIFDEALYGRRTLIDFYLAFNPAALHACDILNGDVNVACLGPQDIDPKARGGIIIEFDLPKLIQKKASAFYKQRDLEYQVDKIRQVQLGSETISFNHTGFVRCAEASSTYLKIVDGRCGGLKQIAEVPKSSLIAYNLGQMHEVLTLNFFRFMDRMSDLDGKINQTYIDNFYHKVNQLTDEGLVFFLTDLEKNMTDTAEFNFYGAHQIDFSTIISITARYKSYILNLPKFIGDLKQGNIHELRQARIRIPELFQSYRFLDYLLLKVEHLDARYYLDDLRKQCKTPNWVQHIPLLIPEGFELSWEMSSEGDTHEQESLVATIEKETNTVAPLLEPTQQILVVIQEDTTEVVTEKHDVIDMDQIAPNNGASTDNLMPTSIDDHSTGHGSLLKLIEEDPVQEYVFGKAFQAHRVQFDTLIEELEEFSSYCSFSHDSTVLLYQPFVQELKKDFAEIGRNFFTDVYNKDKEALTRSFEILKSSCERLSQKAEENFQHNTSLWSYVKPILIGFVGVVIAMAATILTFGIATYHVAKNERLRTNYIDTFFKSESGSIQDAKNKWAQYAVKQKLFGDETLMNHGLVKEIEETISTKLCQ